VDIDGVKCDAIDVDLTKQMGPLKTKWNGVTCTGVPILSSLYSIYCVSVLVKLLTLSSF